MFSLFREEKRAKNINAFWKKQGVKANARVEYFDSFIGYVVRSDLHLRWREHEQSKKY